MNYYQESRNAPPTIEQINGFANLKQTASSHGINYHHDHSQRQNALRAQQFAERDAFPVEESTSTNLYRHELFPGYINSKPLSLQKANNISRTIEGCTSTNQRHYIASSVNRIDEWINERNWVSLVKFVLDTILNILRTKLIQGKQVSENMARGSDDVVMLELCTIHQVISYPDFSQISLVLNNMDKVIEPKLSTNCGVLKSAAVDPELMNKYIPSYRPNIQYNFSDQTGFQTPMGRITEAEAKRALRTLVDFMKSEVADRDQGLTYEPLLSQLIENKDKFLV